MHAELQQAWQLQQSGNLDASERLYSSILRDNPDDADALNCFGILLMQSARPERALEQFRRAAVLSPRDAGVRRNLARAALATGDPETARLAAEAAIGEASDPSAWQLLGNALKDLNRNDDATAAFRAGLQRHPGDFLLRYNIAVSELMAGHPQRAELAFDELARQLPNQALAWQGLGNAQSALGKLSDAERAYRRTLELNPDATQVWVNLAQVLIRTGSTAEALRMLQRALQLDPGNQAALAAVTVAGVGQADLLLDFDRWVLVAPLPAAEPTEAFNERLSGEILGQAGLQKDPKHKTTRGGYQTANLATAESPAIQQFVTQLRPALDQRMAEMGQRYQAAGHPLAGSRPEAWRLNLWATVLERQGHQEPHSHPSGWLSGVYYVALPQIDAQSTAGWLELGRPPSVFPSADSATVRLVQPQAGCLVTFPSYLYHRTLPHQSTQPRISLAFDVLPGD